jgi:hypothetical protein
MRAPPDFVFEQELRCGGLAAVAGVDEVVVGALAGPVRLATGDAGRVPVRPLRQSPGFAHRLSGERPTQSDQNPRLSAGTWFSYPLTRISFVMGYPRPSSEGVGRFPFIFGPEKAARESLVIGQVWGFTNEPFWNFGAAGGSDMFWLFWFSFSMEGVCRGLRL